MPFTSRQDRPAGGSAKVDWWEPLATLYPIPEEPRWADFDSALAVSQLYALGFLSRRTYRVIGTAAARAFGKEAAADSLAVLLDRFGDPRRVVSALLKRGLTALQPLALHPAGTTPAPSVLAGWPALLLSELEEARGERLADRRFYDARFRSGLSIPAIGVRTGTHPSIVARHVRSEIDRIILYHRLDFLNAAFADAPDPLSDRVVG